jgi:hypothetical protein
MRTYKIQPAAFTDQVTDDGQQLTKKPYPIVVRENGEIIGSPLHVAVIGFVRDLARQEVDMPWSGVLVAGRPIYPVVGSYVIVQDRKGRWSTLSTAVESFVPLPDERRDPGNAEPQPVTREELERLLADFAAEVEMDVAAERSGYGPGTVKMAEKIAERLGIRR